MDGLHYQVWLTEALSRQKKLPKLEEFLGKKTRKQDMESELKSMLRGIGTKKESK